MEKALELYRGDFLPGMHVEDSPELERWIEDRRSEYRRAAVEAATALADRDAAAGEVRAALLWARRAAALDPTAESAARRLMSLLDRAGEPAAALAAFHDLEARLRADLALGASEETVRLASAIRRRARTRAHTLPSHSRIRSQAHTASRVRSAHIARRKPPRGLADGTACLSRRMRRRAADRRRPWLSGAMAAAMLVAGLLAWRA
jgi:DNA-binding SARP family transcriptional activator